MHVVCGIMIRQVENKLHKVVRTNVKLVLPSSFISAIEKTAHLSSESSRFTVDDKRQQK